jgi:hypothetical protein
VRVHALPGIMFTVSRCSNCRGGENMGACIAGVSRLRGTNTGADHCCQISVESLLNEIACHQEMKVDVKGVSCKMKEKGCEV